MFFGRHGKARMARPHHPSMVRLDFVKRPFKGQFRFDYDLNLHVNHLLSGFDFLLTGRDRLDGAGVPPQREAFSDGVNLVSRTRQRHSPENHILRFSL